MMFYLPIRMEAQSMTSVFRTGLRASLMLVLLCAYFPPGETSGQTKKEPNSKKREEELKDVYKKWIDEDVSPIITEDERRAFKALKTDEERDKYIEIFW